MIALRSSTLRSLGLLTCLALATACGGGGAAPPPPAGDPPASLTYAENPANYTEGVAITPNAPATTGGTPASYQVTPALPGGLSLDPVTGVISGTPAAQAPMTGYDVIASNAWGSTQETVMIAVNAALPAAFESLAPGFEVEVVLEPGAPNPAKIAKIALTAPADGRIFYLEVDTGQVRVIDPVQGLLPTAFATLNVLQGGHQGLLGLALAPDFATSGHVYVMATVPAAGAQNDRIAVYRYTDVSSVGTNMQVVIDDHPVSPPGGINNGGELLFDSTGRLFVSIGDTMVPALAQEDASASLAGKVLRYDVGTLPATIPGDNPFPGSPEWCRGLRNTFGLAMHPTTGDLFGADNGPANDDELNFLQSGKNFEWGGSPTGPVVGFKIRNYPTVIVPTALCWHDGTGWGAAYENNLFMTTYDELTIKRFVMSGAAYTDIDLEEDFAEFTLDGDKHHPLDIERAADGSLYVSTFTGIYRIHMP